MAFGAFANQLFTRGILSVQLDGIQTAGGAKTQKIAMAHRIQGEGVSHKIDLGVVVGGRAEVLANPKTPFPVEALRKRHRQESRSGTGSIQLQLSVGIDLEARIRPKPCWILREVTIGEILHDLGEACARQQ